MKMNLVKNEIYMDIGSWKEVKRIPDEVEIKLEIEDIKAMLITAIKEKAAYLIEENYPDWIRLRAMDRSEQVDQSYIDGREAIRTKSDELENAIDTCTTFDELSQKWERLISWGN